MCDRCEELEEEVARLKRAMGGLEEDETIGKLRSAYKLDPSQGRLLLLLHRRAGFVHVERIREVLYGDRMDGGPSDNIVKVYLARMRNKLGKDAFETLWCGGYRLSDAGRVKVDRALAA